MASSQAPSVSVESPDDWEGFPLPNVISGDPDGRVHWLRQEGNGDGILLTGMFSAQESVFPYEFIGDESLHLLEGAVTVELEGKGNVELAAGDIASFPKGARSVWHVRAPMKKFFVISG